MALIRDLRAQIPNRTETDALWKYHHEAELRTAGNGEYDEAKWHRERAKVYWRDPLPKTNDDSQEP